MFDVDISTVGWVRIEPTYYVGYYIYIYMSCIYIYILYIYYIYIIYICQVSHMFLQYIPDSRRYRYSWITILQLTKRAFGNSSRHELL